MFKIYRSLEVIDVANPPEPIAVDVLEKTFTDSDVTLGDRWHYRVSATKNGIEKFSDDILAVAGEVDEYWSNVDLLVFADADSFPSSVFTDSSANPKTISKYGSPSIVGPSKITPKFDDGSIFLTSNKGSRIYANLSSALTLQDFTIEGHVYLTANPSQQNYIFFIGDDGTDNTIAVSLTSGRQVYVEAKYSWTYNIIIEGSTLSRNTWHHLCLMRKNGVFYLFVNGALSGSSNLYTTSSIPGTIFTMGNRSGATTLEGQFKGYLSSIRVTKGVARYAIEGFTPPIAKYPN